MNLERKNNKQDSGINPTIFLRNFYKRLYSQEKHDSPDDSRTSLARRIKELLKQGKVIPARVLNIGSGPQALEKQLLRHGEEDKPLKKMAEFFSIDLADIMPSKLLAQKIKSVQHSRADAVALPFQDGSFGLVVSNHAIDFAPQEAAFREAYRVLSDGGKGIFYLHHPSMLREFSEYEEVRTFWQYLQENSILFASEEEIRDFLGKIGFIPKEISTKSDKKKDDTWWEVVVEKRTTPDTVNSAIQEGHGK